MLRKLGKSKYILQCSICKAVPGFEKESRKRYPCIKTAAFVCEECRADRDMKHPFEPFEYLASDIISVCFCPNFKNGCREIFSESETLKEHKESCIFHTLPCFFIQSRIGRRIFKRCHRLEASRKKCWKVCRSGFQEASHYFLMF